MELWGKGCLPINQGGCFKHSGLTGLRVLAKRILQDVRRTCQNRTRLRWAFLPTQWMFLVVRWQLIHRLAEVHQRLPRGDLRKPTQEFWSCKTETCPKWSKVYRSFKIKEKVLQLFPQSTQPVRYHSLHNSHQTIRQCDLKFRFTTSSSFKTKGLSSWMLGLSHWFLQTWWQNMAEPRRIIQECWKTKFRVWVWRYSLGDL